jgi:hypothetical protein
MRFHAPAGGDGEVFVLLDRTRVHVVVSGDIGAHMSLSLALATADVVRAARDLDVHARHLRSIDATGTRFLEELVARVPGRPRLLDPPVALLEALVAAGSCGAFEVVHREHLDGEALGRESSG